MARLEKRFVKRISGAIGDELYRTLANGKISVSDKAASPIFKDPDDLEQRDKRITGFGGSSYMSSVVRDAIRVGFASIQRGENLTAKFVEINATTLCKAVRGEDGKFKREYDFPAMRLSFGVIEPPLVTAAIDTEQRAVTFTQEGQGEESDGSNCDSKDQLYGYLLDGTSGKEKGRLVKLRARAESGSTTAMIPEGWDTAKLHVYAFAVYYNKKRASPTLHLFPAGS